MKSTIKGRRVSGFRPVNIWKIRPDEQMANRQAAQRDFVVIGPAGLESITLKARQSQELEAALGQLSSQIVAARKSWQPVVETILKRLEPVSLDDAFKDLEELADLELDWDSYCGLAPTARAVATAGRLIVAVGARCSHTAGERAEPYSVLPIADGGIQVEWHGSGGNVEVNIGPKGAVGYLVIEHPDGEPSFRKGTRVAWPDLMHEIEALLRG